MFIYAIVNAFAFAIVSLIFGVRNKTEIFVRIGLIIMSVYNFVQAAQYHLGVV